MKTKEIIYKLLRDHEDQLGANELTNLVYTSFKKCIDDVYVKSVKELLAQVYDFINIITKSEPKITPLNNTFRNLLYIIKKDEKKLFEQDISFVKAYIKNEIDNRKKNIHRYQERAIENGSKCIEDGDVIMVHSVSYTMFGSLEKAVHRKKMFKVYVAQQEPKKTDLIIKKLRHLGITTEVVPEYAINHVIDKVTKIFFGALSITSDGHFLANIGTKAIISIAKLRNIEIYILSSCLKFTTEPMTKQNIHAKKELHHVQDMSYPIIKFSHDFIGLDNVTYIVTDEGKFHSDNFKQLYGKVKEKFFFMRNNNSN